MSFEQERNAGTRNISLSLHALHIAYCSLLSTWISRPCSTRTLSVTHWTDFLLSYRVCTSLLLCAPSRIRDLLFQVFGNHFHSTSCSNVPTNICRKRKVGQRKEKECGNRGRWEEGLNTGTAVERVRKRKERRERKINWKKNDSKKRIDDGKRKNEKETDGSKEILNKNIILPLHPLSVYMKYYCNRWMVMNCESGCGSTLWF